MYSYMNTKHHTCSCRNVSFESHIFKQNSITPVSAWPSETDNIKFAHTSFKVPYCPWIPELHLLLHCQIYMSTGQICVNLFRLRIEKLND